MKKVLSIMCLLLTTTFFIGCGKAIKPEDTNNEQNVEDTSETKKEESSVPKSDDLYSFEIVLNGQSYKLPADYSEFEKNGWSFKDNIGDKKLAPNQYTLTNVMKNGDKQIYASVVNTGKDELPLNKCKVGGINLDSFMLKDGATLVLPKGISFSSTKDDVIKAYGNPTRTSEQDTSTYMYYEVDSYQKVEINIDKKSGKVSRIELQNLNDKSASDSKSSDSSSGEVPESVKSYKAPTELTDDIGSFNVKYDGVLYHMPAPFSEFEKNGWSFQDVPKGDISAREFQNGIVLRKGNQTIRTAVFNNSGKSTNAKNCFITQVIGDDYTSNFPIELPKGIKVGSTREEVQAAYSGANIKKGDSASLEYYTYTKQTLEEVQIIVNKQTGKVSKISVQYVPGKEDYK
ncbi:hypothetical protein NNC19_09140 [Clostridium sp. SHJSY1]|uniref:hypothetical protein n=1 Tax=Clostridium sp. SHJSY1 TaxID=2942483 RepID=UPI002876A7D6|nr:hypothetical protein [Clostridium sp. SHJSY1]MDS0525840.1 hypothetical protein [Clostridium sp. SHJSY1]